jgi:hypothetical protein
VFASRGGVTKSEGVLSGAQRGCDTDSPCKSDSEKCKSAEEIQTGEVQERHGWISGDEVAHGAA